VILSVARESGVDAGRVRGAGKPEARLTAGAVNRVGRAGKLARIALAPTVAVPVRHGLGSASRGDRRRPRRRRHLTGGTVC
jgi:hypothetical protein